MRENRLYGSEGGEAKSLPYPYHGSAAARPPIVPRLVRLSLHDRFWELVGGPSRGGMDGFALLAMTGSALMNDSQSPKGS